MRSRGLLSLLVGASMASFFLLISGVASAVESARVADLDRRVRQDPDQEQITTWIGLGTSGQFRKRINDVDVKTNDFFIVLIDRRDPSQSILMMDLKKDGLVDRVVKVPGVLNSEDERAATLELLSFQSKQLDLLKRMADMERKEKGDRPFLNRRLEFVNVQKELAVAFSYATGELIDLTAADAVQLQEDFAALVESLLLEE